MSVGFVGLADDPICDSWRSETRQLARQILSSFRISRAYSEDGLHLSQIRPWMLSCQHLDDKTPNAPNIRLLRISRLLDYLRSHPEDRALQRSSVEAHVRERI